MAVPGIIRHYKSIHPAIGLALLITGVTGLGISLAFLLTSPLQELTACSLTTLFYLWLIAIDPLHGLLIWLVSHPFTASTVKIELGSSVPDLSLARLCVGFVLILMVAQIATGRRKAHGITRVEVAFLLFVIGFGASMVGILTPTSMLRTLFDQWVMPLIVYFAVKNLVTDRQKLHRMLKLLLFVGAYSAIYMLYELTTGNILFLSGKLGHVYYRDTSLRIVRGLYGTTLTFGLLFNWLLPIAVHYFLKAPTMARKALYGLIFGLMLVGDILTYKRATWLAMLASFLIMQWFYPQLRRFFVALVLLFAVVLAFTWSSVGQSEIVTDRALNEEQWDTAAGRKDRWSEGWALWQQKPFFGHGYKAYNEVAEHENVENDYLNILVSSGLAGFVPYMAFYIFTLVDSIMVYWQIGTNKKLFVDRELLFVFWGLFSTYFITAYASSGIDGHTMAPLVFFAIIGAIVGSQAPLLAHSERRENKVLSLLRCGGSSC